MRTIKPTVLGLLTRPFEFRRQFRLAVAATAFIKLGEDDALLPEAAMWPLLAKELGEQVLDAGMPKSRAEFLATAHAFAPGGQAVPGLQVRILLGALEKQLRVFGDRYLLGEQPSAPQPFTRMALNWARAYGGPAVAENPLGMGTQPVETPAGRLLPAANVVGAAYRVPASFLPLEQTWPQRAVLAGTYGEAWLQEEFPGLPRDIDWRFFNTAPADQQFPALLRGDEAYELENLHPERRLITGRLPGLAPRLFLRRVGESALEEVALGLTTVWFLPHCARAVLVFHGHAQLREEDGADIEVAMLGADMHGAPRPLAAFEEAFAQRLDKQTRGRLALRDDMLVPAALLAPDPALEAARALLLPKTPLRERRQRRMALEREKARARLRAAGMDPDQHLPPEEEEEPLPTDEAGLQALADRLLQEAEARKAAALARQHEETAKTAAFLAASGLPPLPETEPTVKGPPRFSAAAARAAMARTQAGFGAFAPDFLARMQADEATQARMEQAERQLREGYQLSAHYQNPADRRADAEQPGLRAAIGQADDQVRAHYDFSGADFAGMDFSGRDLSGICLDGADLQGCNFRGARLCRAVLAHARLHGACFAEADLTGANLGKAKLQEADFSRATLEDAILHGAQLHKARLVQARLAGVQLLEAALEGADFSQAQAPGLLLMKTSLAGWQAAGIDCPKAKFLETDLTGADVSGANLAGAAFITCCLDGARLPGARLQKAVFVQESTAARADFSGADLSGAFLRGTRLEAARFTRADLTGADFSFALLEGAALERVNATQARFIAARLQGADLRHANLLRADLSRADLRGADLRQAGLTEANMARVRLDGQSRTEGIATTRMRHLPRYRAQEVA